MDPIFDEEGIYILFYTQDVTQPYYFKIKFDELKKQRSKGIYASPSSTVDKAITKYKELVKYDLVDVYHQSKSSLITISDKTPVLDYQKSMQGIRKKGTPAYNSPDPESFLYINIGDFSDKDIVKCTELMDDEQFKKVYLKFKASH